ncbi:putative choriogenin Hminor [Stagonosporopsis vannaccii]|nr:putative choriogenin Hminor [Stagonosporopsis vannaccii]
MMGDKKKSSRRLSSLFSLGGSSEPQQGSSAASSESSGRLSKVKNRISSAASTSTHQSATHLTAPEYPPPSPQRRQSPPNQLTIQPVGGPPALESLEPPPHLDVPSRSSSPGGVGSRPGTPNVDNEGKLRKLRRKSGLFGGANSSMTDVSRAGGAGENPLAWIVGHKGKVPYSLTMLLNGEKVPELWDDQADTLVYLFPRTSGKGPSFRIDSSVYAASQLLTRLVHGSLYSDEAELPTRPSPNEQGQEQSRPASPDQSQVDSSDGSKGSRALSDATDDDHTEKHLYMPIALSSDDAITPTEPRLSQKDIDTLVTYRNFFAFLIGQSLVATSRHSDIFDIFLRIADILSHYAFSNVDGSTFGEVAASSFDSYVDELNMADVRQSREKTIEAIVLGERMRSMTLYTEGFVHAVGKYDDVKGLQSPKWEMVSPKTGTRMARAALDLDNREANINHKLKDFEFAAIFSGIMNSAMADEGKTISFKRWRSAFMSTRSWMIDYYKHKYGSWLPKARNKKNNLTTNGLNRLVLRDMYRDLSSLYDLLVDRGNLTNRTADGFIVEDEGTGFVAINSRAMRKALSEYDRSTPPVQPPIPFDLPLYPSLKGIKADYPTGDEKKDAKARGKKLKSEEIAKVLQNASNADARQLTPVLESFLAFEKKQASGSTLDELWELRSGQWLFIYAVIQSLPMLVVDAPGVRFTEGVEYFLCEVPRSGVPWVREDTTRARTWFGVQGGAQVVSLPTDVVEHGVEGVFRRSHCWKRAQEWAANDMLLNAAMQELNGTAAPLPPPPGMLDPSSAQLRPRSQSPHDQSKRNSVMNLGLEALPLPPGIVPPSAPSVNRPQSSSDPSRTFDDILGAPPPNPKEKKKKW